MSTKKNKNQYHIVFTGGGTGGHVFPGLSLITPLLRMIQSSQYDTPHTVSRSSFLWIGSHKGPEKIFVKEQGLTFQSISSGKLRRYFSLQNAIDPLKVMWGYVQSLFILKKARPTILVSLGGFVSVPVVLAARSLDIAVVSVCSDLSLGLATRINLSSSLTLFCAYEETKTHILSREKYRAMYVRRKKHFQRQGERIVASAHTQDGHAEQSSLSMDEWIQVVGNPIREEVYQGDANAINARYSMDMNEKVILFLGGSKGALPINKMVSRILPRFSADMTVIHQTGIENNEAPTSEVPLKSVCQYIVVPFLKEEYADILARADIVVARAGAGTLWEIIANAIPAIIIPFERGSRGDQIENANYFAKKGLLLDVGSEPSDEEVFQSITRLITHEDIRQHYIAQCRTFGARGGAHRIASYIFLCISNYF